MFGVQDFSTFHAKSQRGGIQLLCEPYSYINRGWGMDIQRQKLMLKFAFLWSHLFQLSDTNVEFFQTLLYETPAVFHMDVFIKIFFIAAYIFETPGSEKKNNNLVCRYDRHHIWSKYFEILLCICNCCSAMLSKNAFCTVFCISLQMGSFRFLQIALFGRIFLAGIYITFPTPTSKFYLYILKPLQKYV